MSKFSRVLIRMSEFLLLSTKRHTSNRNEYVAGHVKGHLLKQMLNN